MEIEWMLKGRKVVILDEMRDAVLVDLATCVKP